MAVDQVHGLPDNELFRRLLLVAESRQETLIHDIPHGVDVTYRQLVRDVSSFRQKLREALPESLLTDKGIVRDDDVFVCTTTSASYEMIVALFAILSIGAAIVPLSPSLMPEEVMNFYHRFDAKCIITHPKAELVKSLRQHVTSMDTVEPNIISVHASGMEQDVEDPYPFIDSSIVLPTNRPAIALFSSGTTGPPKGIIHGLGFFTEKIGPLGAEDALVLAHRPMHYAASLASTIATILRGVRLEISPLGSSPQYIWERLRQGGVTNLAGSAGFWVSLMEYYLQNIAILPLNERQAYVDGARGLRVAICSGVMAMPSTKIFWKEIRGRPLQVVWGSTESALGLKTSTDIDTTYLNSIGQPVPGVTVKLSEGGEMRVKTPAIYWKDERATRAAFDDEGFYKTGDLVYLQGSDYIIQGRASTDFISCNSIKIPILHVENALSLLPYLSEAHVLPVTDPKTGSRVAALVRCRNGQKSNLTLHSLREDLSPYLSLVQLPTVLRVLVDGEEVPRTVSNKVIRRETKQIFFPQTADPSLSELPTQVQWCDFKLDTDLRPQKMWDSGGVQ
ncbi:acetyl-CoA synthetase-like protein [Aspergillus bertholletiae]|uniref:Acetyl-CoA synthetase-like protein n=1 Tax=Aspergillus bertholletiae TaxID=1226010 RepID=A0A5N7BLP4_9EURO|nr:acetyl-CoA synthetase-like protein [Aspergillus bertholletiae]